MIDEETVFILGAGSSCLYGFPTGRKLRSDIISNTLWITNGFKEYLNPKISRQAKSFVENFDASNIQSIDKFISQRPEYHEIGAFAIAFEILYAESKAKTSERIADNDKYKDWYFYLHNKMLANCSRPEDCKLYSKNKISFVTFNYDRSLDHYLYNSFINSFPKNFLGLNSIDLENPYLGVPLCELFPFKFIHVYGAAPLPWQAGGPESVGYGIEFDVNEETFNRINTTAKHIRTIDDQRNDNQLVNSAQAEISKAKQVFFLGFGYAEENLKILNIPESIEGKKVFGTALGFSAKNIRDTIKSIYNGDANIHPFDKDDIRGYHTGKYKFLDIDCAGLLNQFL